MCLDLSNFTVVSKKLMLCGLVSEVNFIVACS